jgi:hypothetical protein
MLALTIVAHVVPAFALFVLFGWLGVVLAVVSVAAFVSRANHYLRGEKRGALAVAIDVAYFTHWTAGLVAIPLALAATCTAWIVGASASHAIAIAYGASIAVSAYGAYVRRKRFSILRVEISIEGLDARFDGYRIAHLSDLHIGQFSPHALGMRWSRAANALSPDLTVVTGDMVANGSAFHEDIADVVGSLRAKDGVVVAMGNHDYGRDAERLVGLIEARGPRVLRNAGVRLLDGDSLFLAAIDDRWSRRANLDEALRDRPLGARSILLAHDPVDFSAAAARGVDLVLSGHTHGGQVALPFFARFANAGRMHRRHTLGVYREGKSALVVHPGLGTSGPPVRVGVAPAVVEITLRAA